MQYGGVSMAEGKGKPPGDEKVSVTIRLPADLVEAVDEMAEEELRSRSSQIQKLLEQTVPKQEAPAGKR